MPGNPILLLEADPTAGDEIRATLTRGGHTVATALDVEGAIRMAPSHQMVIIDAVAGPMSAPDACRALRANAESATKPILCISRTDDVEERIAFLEAGADDVMARPFDARELEARVEALVVRFQRSRDMSPMTETGPEPRRARRVVVVFSPKGGVGTTTIAVNVATVARQLHPDRTLLVDLDLQFGQVVTHLNLPLNHSLADLARDDEALRDPELLRTYITTHDSGLQVIGAPGSPELAQLVTGKHVERLIATALTSFEAIVIDAGSTLDERSLAAFEAANSIILPIVAELGALKALHTMLDYLNETGSVMGKATFVLNNIFAKDLLKSSDVEGFLGTKMGVELPYDPLIYVKAVNEGVPVSTGAPKSAAAERLSKLAGIAFGGDAGTSETAQLEHRGRLSGLLRRA